MNFVYSRVMLFFHVVWVLLQMLQTGSITRLRKSDVTSGLLAAKLLIKLGVGYGTRHVSVKSMTELPVDSSPPASCFSVIVPTLNEAALIVDFLAHLRARAPGAEIIVVDGNSLDQTAALASRQADHVLQSPRGRAKQMNAGAAIAKGQILWFVHADSLVPSGALDYIASALADPKVAGGCFRLRFPRRQWIYRISDHLGNVAVDLFQIALGDHGIFCRRTAFMQVGGYPEVFLMEDAEFYRRLRSGYGRMKQLSAYIVSSPRRYEQLGPLRTTVLYLVILLLYLAKASPHMLQAIYQRFVANKTSF